MRARYSASCVISGSIAAFSTIEHRGHDQVAGRAHARDREVVARTAQATFRGGRDDVALVDLDRGAERFHALDVEIDRTRPSEVNLSSAIRLFVLDWFRSSKSA